MRISVVSGPRKDGKYLVSFSTSGGPNGFGGLDYGKTSRKLMTAEQIAKIPEKYTSSEFEIPRHLLAHRNNG